MNAYEQLMQAFGPLKERQEKEATLPNDVAELKKQVSLHRNVIIAILQELTEEQRQRIMEKVKGKSQ